MSEEVVIEEENSVASKESLDEFLFPDGEYWSKKKA